MRINKLKTIEKTIHANSFPKKELVIGIPQTGKSRDIGADIKAYHQGNKLELEEELRHGK